MSYCYGSNIFNGRAYAYDVTVPPVNPAVSLADVKAQLRILDTSSDALLTSYIAAATDYAEKYTRRDFITRTYQTFRDCFPSNYYCDSISGFELRRSKLQNVNSITYLVDGVSTVLATSVYYNTVQNDYSLILLEPDEQWPTNADKKLQSVTIEFTAGYGLNDTDVPVALRTAITQIVAALYENRGDCGGSNDSSSSSSSCDCAGLAPVNAMSTLKQYRIETL